jgi:hypothetical protein
MGKRAKGLDAVRQNNMLKKQMLSACKKYAEQLEKENFELKNDPNTIIGQFIGQFRELYGQNQRLSVLTASLIRKLDEKVILTKEEMESFKDKRINIKWEIADGETVETAKEFIFTYELEDAPPQGQPVQATELPSPASIASAALVDIQATQDAVAEQAAATEELDLVCKDPDCPASENGPHIHSKALEEEISSSTEESLPQ